MGKMDGTWAVLAVLVVLLGGFAGAATYLLDDSGDWDSIADTPEGQYLLAISKIKQDIQTGEDEPVMKALEKLKNDFPELAGEQVDEYIEAEKLYFQGKLGKAATRYKQFLTVHPDSLLYPVASERLYSIGVAWLQGEKRTFLKILRLPAFDDGADLMWDIADREGNSPMSLRALTTLAENQERRQKYFDAYQTWAEIATRWPTGKIGQESLLRMAQELHASYTGPEYDAAALASARSYYEDFIGRYPDLAEALNVGEELAMIQEQLAYKAYQTGFYYERTDKPDAAAMYYDKVLDEWPESKAAVMAAQRVQAGAPPAVKQTPRRKLFHIGNRFLDSWFGIEKLHDKWMESQNRETVQ